MLGKTFMKLALLLTIIAALPIALKAENAQHSSLEADQKIIEEKKWIITSIHKSDTEKYDSKHLGFIKFSNGSIEGQSTCNLYDGVYSIGENQKFEIFRIGTSLVNCKVGNKMKIEADYVAGLEQVTKYKLEDDQLILLQEGDREFVRFKLKK